MNFLCETFITATDPEVIIMGFVPMLEVETTETKLQPFKFRSVSFTDVKIAGCSEDGFIMVLRDENKSPVLEGVTVEISGEAINYSLDSEDMTDLKAGAVLIPGDAV